MDRSTRLADIRDLHRVEVAAVLQRSRLLLQRKAEGGGQDGEMREAGGMVERYVREVLASVAPHSKRITSGYLVDPASIAAEGNLPQFDVICHSVEFPPILSVGHGDIDIVPIESAVGVFEVKRRLTKRSVAAACAQLKRARAMFDQAGRTPREPLRAVVPGTMMPGTRSPVLGLIGLDHEPGWSEAIDESCVTIASSFSGEMSFWTNGLGQFGSTPSLESVNDGRLKHLSDEGDPVQVLMLTLAVLRLWFARTCGKGVSDEAALRYYGVFDPAT